MALEDYLRFVLALAFVLGLIAAAAWAFRRFGRNGALPRRQGANRRRLAIVEAVALDARRRLVLVRRDDCEHLLIVGAQGETVVETGIIDRAAPTNITAHPPKQAESSTMRPASHDEAGAHAPDSGKHAADYRGGADDLVNGDRPRRAQGSFLRLVRQSNRETS